MPSDDERTLAALAHAGIVLNIVSMGGIVAAAVIWATQRGRSRFVAQHALQALLFQGLGLTLTLLGGLTWGGCLLLGLLPVVMRPDLYRSGPPAVFWFVLITGLMLLGFVLVGVLYAAIAAIQAWRGQPFRYVLVGQLVDRQAAISHTPGEGAVNQTFLYNGAGDPVALGAPAASRPITAPLAVPSPPADVDDPTRPST